jgi:pimeloyl-ACP methyl ester carboxylesterase
MPTAAANPNPNWLRRIIFLLLSLSLLLAAAGLVYQSLASARDRRAFPMPGQLIDIGGYKLHIQCTGAGSPTVLLDSGLGDGYTVWQKVQPQISQVTRVCSYDRAGYGYSESSPRPRTSLVIAEELHALAHAAHLPAPYILVGHSMGGLEVRLYAARYAADVVGMVLVDSSHPNQIQRFPPALNDLDKTWVREQEFLTAIMPFGVPRLMGFCGSNLEARADKCNFHSEREALAELKAFPESAQQAASAGALGDLPLVVLSSDPDRPEPDLPEDLVAPMNQAWQQMQEELARLSTRGTRVVAKNSGHYIQLDRPDLVIDAVRGVVQQARAEDAKQKSDVIR